MKLQSLLGFARAAGKLEAGRMACERAVRKGKAKLLLVAVDASPATVAEMKELGSMYGVRTYQVAVTMYELGETLGRSPVAVVCVTDRHFAVELEKVTVSSDD